MARALQKSITISHISELENFERLLDLLGEKYKCKQIEDEGESVVGHCRISLQKNQEINIVVYTTDRVLIRASPRTASELFDKEALSVEIIAKQATTLVSITRPLTAQRAKTILDYTLTLNPDEEIQRMVIIILCDTANEIILREKLKALGFQGAPLDEGIPDKIKRIEDKGHVVYRAEEVKNIRELRNGIVHRGDIPDQGQTEKCLEITRNLLTHT